MKGAPACSVTAI